MLRRSEECTHLLQRESPILRWPTCLLARLGDGGEGRREDAVRLQGLRVPRYPICNGKGGQERGQAHTHDRCTMCTMLVSSLLWPPASLSQPDRGNAVQKTFLTSSLQSLLVKTPLCSFSSMTPPSKFPTLDKSVSPPR